MDTRCFDFLSGALSNIVGAFFGFGLAILLQARTEKAKKREQTRKVIKSIIDELTDISLTIQDYIDAKTIVKQKIGTPAWEAILSSGIILELLDDKSYTQIINIYCLINFYNDNLQTVDDNCLLYQMSEIVKEANKIIDVKSN